MYETTISIHWLHKLSKYHGYKTMRPNQYGHSAILKWSKWSLFIICLLFIGFFIYSMVFYQGLVKAKTNGIPAAQERMFKSSELTKISHIDPYQGKEFYMIGFGETKDEQQQIIFLPKKKSKEPIIIDADEIIKKEKIANIWREACNACELIKITPAMESNKPLWEITYIDSSNHYIFEYLSMYDGSQYEQFRFSRD